MSALRMRIAAPLVVASLGLGLAATFAYAAPAPGVATGVAPAAGASSPSGKPVAPIAIGYELAAQPEIGVPFDVRISARGGDGIADLTLAVHSGDGVEAGTPQLTTSSADGGAHTWTVTATAFNEGTLYLSVLVQGTAGDQHPARNLVIPIRIGAEPPTRLAASVQPTTDFSAVPVIVLPATERAR